MAGTVCPICYDSLDSSDFTPCGHKVHIQCILKHKASCHLKTAICPICRTPVTFEEKQDSDEEMEYDPNGSVSTCRYVPVQMSPGRYKFVCECDSDDCVLTSESFFENVE